MKVKNILSNKFIKNESVYIGRSSKRFKQSPLANPFLLENESKREDVVQAYREWLWGKMSGLSMHTEIGKKYELKVPSKWKETTQQQVISELIKIGSNNLDVYCYCSPKLCHGDIVIKATKWLLNL
jgi:hypothetical protein